MDRNAASVEQLIERLYDLGFLPSQVDSIVLQTAGTLDYRSLPAGRRQKLIKELESCIWFSQKCRSIG